MALLATEKEMFKIVPNCFVHKEEEAKAVCLQHHYLMCLDCLLARDHHNLSDCSLISIDKLKSGTRKAMVDLLSLTQTLEKKEEEFNN